MLPSSNIKGSKITWISECWGVSAHSNGHEKRPVYCVMFGDNDCAAVSGFHRTARRAKKEITHYINKGFRTAYHGAKRRTKQSSGIASS